MTDLPAPIWTRAEPDGTVLVGLGTGWYDDDDLISSVALPMASSVVQGGEPLVRVEVKSKVCEGDVCTYVASTITFAAPGSMRIEELNMKVVGDPVLLQEDPLAAGWLLRATSVDPADSGQD